MTRPILAPPEISARAPRIVLGPLTRSSLFLAPLSRSFQAPQSYIMFDWWRHLCPRRRPHVEVSHHLPLPFLRSCLHAV